MSFKLKPIILLIGAVTRVSIAIVPYINLITTDLSFHTRLRTVAFIGARYAVSRSGFYSLLCIYTSSPQQGMVVQVPCLLEMAPEDHQPLYNRTNRDLMNCLANPGPESKLFLNVAQLHLLYSQRESMQCYLLP